MDNYIKSTRYLCLYRDECIIDTSKFFNKLYVIIFNNKKENKITIDLSDLESITAGAAVYLFALVTDSQNNIKHNLFAIIWPTDKATKKLIVDTGLFKLLQSGCKNKLRKIFSDDSNFFCGKHKDIEKCKDVIRKRIGDDTLSVLLDSALQETFLNINHHAYNNVSKRKLTWWCYAVLDKDESGSYLSITVCDLGMTIPYTMRNVPTLYKVRTESESIETAMIERVTSTKDKDRGKGSSDIQSPINYTECENSYLFIHSGLGQYYMGKKKINAGQINFNLLHGYKLFGTVLEWQLYYDVD
jgi:anti-anti-sigma regulatory factor